MPLECVSIIRVEGCQQRLPPARGQVQSYSQSSDVFRELVLKLNAKWLRGGHLIHHPPILIQDSQGNGTEGTASAWKLLRAPDPLAFLSEISGQVMVHGLSTSRLQQELALVQQDCLLR